MPAPPELTTNAPVVVDVETTGGFDKPLVYDLGIAICDKDGKVHIGASFIIDEIFNNKALMSSA